MTVQPGDVLGMYLTTFSGDNDHFGVYFNDVIDAPPYFRYSGEPTELTLQGDKTNVGLPLVTFEVANNNGMAIIDHVASYFHLSPPYDV